MLKLGLRWLWKKMVYGGGGVGGGALTGWLDGSGRRGVELVRRRDVPISSGDNYVCTKRKDMSQSAAVIKIVL
jgi:hypothetical protein